MQDHFCGICLVRVWEKFELVTFRVQRVKFQVANTVEVWKACCRDVYRTYRMD